MNSMQSLKIKLKELDDIEKEMAGGLHSAGLAMLELGKEKPSMKQVESNAASFLKTLQGVENGLLKHIIYLTQVSTVHPHEGSSYAAQKVFHMALHRLEHARSRMNELERLRQQHLQQDAQFNPPQMPGQQGPQGSMGGGPMGIGSQGQMGQGSMGAGQGFQGMGMPGPIGGGMQGQGSLGGSIQGGQNSIRHKQGQMGGPICQQGQMGQGPMMTQLSQMGGIGASQMGGIGVSQIGGIGASQMCGMGSMGQQGPMGQGGPIGEQFGSSLMGAAPAQIGMQALRPGIMDQQGQMGGMGGIGSPQMGMGPRMSVSGIGGQMGSQGP